MKRYIKPLGILAALMLVVGGLYGVDQLKAGEGCSSSAKAEATKVEATGASASCASDAKAQTANAQSAGKSCCPSGVKAQTAQATDAVPSCVTGVKAQTAGASGASCATNAKTANAGSSCSYDAKTASAGCGSKAEGANTAELMNAEDCMYKLAHCGIDVRGKDAEALAAKLVEKGCNEYSKEQWAGMIKSAQAMDAKEADAIFAKATSSDPCPGDDCPMKQVAMDLAASETVNN